MPAPLRCPTCSAPLEVPPEHATTTLCTYCGAGVLLTERGGHVEAAAAQQRYSDAIGEVLAQLRAGSKIGAIKVYRDHFGVGLAEARDAVNRLEAGQPGGPPAPAAPRAKTAGTTGQTLAFVAVLVALIAGALLFDGMKPRPRVATSPAAPGPAAAAPASPLERLTGRSSLAREVLRFGSEGNGAGRFEDARSVAVDGAGRIYVAEYSGGRVQVFDSAGTFLTQWMVDPKKVVLDMVADRQGTVYVSQPGQTLRVEGPTGRRLGELPRPRPYSYDALALALDGSVWAATDATVVHLSREGEVLQTINIKEAVGDDASVERVAVAGNGHLYVLDQWTGEVYHLNPDGRFVDRFGPGENDRGSSLTPDDLAVDGRGRIYMSDMGAAIRVFEPDGREIGAFGRGVVFGITINDRDELFATHRNDHQIVKYQLTR